jgi:phenylacetate-CoA ligase
VNFATLRRNIFEPIQIGIANSNRLSYWKLLEKTQWLTKKQLEDIQWFRLQDLWSFLWQHNEYYRARFRNAGLDPGSLSTPEDIKRLPILCKKDIRENTKDLISHGFEINSLLHFKTGGSTGKALDIFLTDECSEMRNACARRHDRWAGWNPGEAIGAVWGNPNLPKTIKEKLMNELVQPYIYLDTMALSDNSVRKFVYDWRLAKPSLLFGHAHSLYVLAKEMDKLGISGIDPAGIISTSMMLLPHERHFIEGIFGVKVTDRYGCEEVSLIGSECEYHNGMHLNIEHLVIEFVKDDGSYAAAGEQGNIVVTDLMNMAMPLVRYKVEDIGVPIELKCRCGRGLPLMGNVTGRVADFLVKHDGTKVAGVSLIENTLTNLPGIDQLQIIQENYEYICLNVVPGKNYSSAAGKSLVDYFVNVFGKEVHVTLQLTGEIAPEQSGKYRFSICRIAQ